VPPLEYCEQFVSQSGGFSSAEAVFKGGRHMAATEIAAEPLVRQEVRKQYQVRGGYALYRLLHRLWYRLPHCLLRWSWCAACRPCRATSAPCFGCSLSCPQPTHSLTPVISPSPAPAPAGPAPPCPCLQETAAIWTKPTAAGEAAINPFHPLGPVKRLAAKPLRVFEGTDHFLRLLQAEKEGLVSGGAVGGGGRGVGWAGLPSRLLASLPSCL
jgi:hypothetical protein